MLEGWEIKAIRAGRANIKESYVIVRDGEVFIFACTSRRWPRPRRT